MIFSKIATRRSCWAILEAHVSEEPGLDKALTYDEFQYEFESRGYLYYDPPYGPEFSPLLDRNRLILLDLVKNSPEQAGTLTFDFRNFPFALGSWYADWDDGTTINYGGISTVAGGIFTKTCRDGYIMVGYNRAGNTSIPAIQCELYGSKTRIPSSDNGANKINIGYVSKTDNPNIKVLPLYS